MNNIAGMVEQELAVKIVNAYVRQNRISAAQLASIVKTVCRSLAGLGAVGIPMPAVPIRYSVHQDYVVCLECGRRGLVLRQHLANRHGLSVDEYRRRWNLSREYPMIAPSYSEQQAARARRLGLSKALGVGRRAQGGKRGLGQSANPSRNLVGTTWRKAAR